MIERISSRALSRIVGLNWRGDFIVLRFFFAWCRYRWSSCFDGTWRWGRQLARRICHVTFLIRVYFSAFRCMRMKKLAAVWLERRRSVLIWLMWKDLLRRKVCYYKFLHLNILWVEGEASFRLNITVCGRSRPFIYIFCPLMKQQMFDCYSSWFTAIISVDDKEEAWKLRQLMQQVETVKFLSYLSILLYGSSSADLEILYMWLVKL